MPVVPREAGEEPHLQDQGAGGRGAGLPRLVGRHAQQEVDAMDGDARACVEGRQESHPQVIGKVQQLTLVLGLASEVHGERADVAVSEDPLLGYRFRVGGQEG